MSLRNLDIGQPSITIWDLRLKYQHFGAGFTIKNVSHLDFGPLEMPNFGVKMVAMIRDIEVP